MKLPYPFIIDGEEITDFEVRSLTAGNLADVQKAGRIGAFSAMKKVAEGVLESLNDNDDPILIKNAVQQMPFYSLNSVVLFGGAKTKGVEYVEGDYKCPRCGTIRSYRKTEDLDEADYLERLVKEPAKVGGIAVKLMTPVLLKNSQTKEVLLEVTELALGYPTITDFIRGEGRYPNDDIRQTMYAYSQALTEVNGETVDREFRFQYGELIFSGMAAKDMNLVSEKLNRQALGVMVDRECLNCGYQWKANLDMSNFFDFGQQ